MKSVYVTCVNSVASSSFGSSRGSYLTVNVLHKLLTYLLTK